MKLLIRTFSFLFLASILGVGAYAVAGPQSDRVAAQEACVSREVPLDEGYGVTRVELREVCER